MFHMFRCHSALSSVKSTAFSFEILLSMRQFSVRMHHLKFFLISSYQMFLFQNRGDSITLLDVAHWAEKSMLRGRLRNSFFFYFFRNLTREKFVIYLSWRKADVRQAITEPNTKHNNQVWLGSVSSGRHWTFWKVLIKMQKTHFWRPIVLFDDDFCQTLP